MESFEVITGQLSQYIKRCVQRGLRDTQPENTLGLKVEFDDGKHSVLTVDDIEMIIEEAFEGKVLLRMKLLMGLGQFRQVIASKRREMFAETWREFDDQHLIWKDVSRTAAPRTREALVMELSRRIAPRTIERIENSPSHESWREVEISHFVRRANESSGLFEVRSEFRMELEARHLVIAYSQDEVLADWICAEFPEILDVFTPAPGGAIAVAVHVRPKGTSNAWSKLSFEKDPELQSRINIRYPETVAAGLEIWSSQEISLRGPYQVSLICDWELLFVEGYIHWAAPHRLWLKKLTVDLSAFLPAVHNRIQVLPSLAMRPLIHIDQSLGVCEVEVNDWVDAGRSIDVRWNSP